MPGPCSSSSISSCGAKYPVCGPNTAAGCPLSVYWPDTTSALDMPCFALSRLPGSTPGAAVVGDVAEPVGSNTSCCGTTEPGSGMATPCGEAGLAAYGECW